MQLCALVPAYKPDRALLDVVSSLSNDQRFLRIFVVDDGSGESFASLFNAAEAIPRVSVLRHAVNLGKGAALKTGMNAILVGMPQCSCVTVDADGQHTWPDISRVAEAATNNPHALVLGTRLFDGDVPLRSRIGNTLTRHVFRLVVGHYITDTQTGLRAIPAPLMRDLLALPSNRYEFEMDMLVLAAQKRVHIREETIQTIYLAGNATSHFNPFFDSVRIYFVLLRFALSSGTAYFIDFAAFLFALTLTDSVLASQLFARTCSIPVNFWLVREFTFDARGRPTSQFVFYLLVVLVSGTISYFLQVALNETLGLPVLISKVAVEFVLFFANFLVLRDWVFNKRPGTG